VNSKLRPRVAFFFGQVTVQSGEKCHHPTPGHSRYLRVPNKKSTKPKTHVFSKPTISSSTKQKEEPLMAIVAGLTIN